MKKLKKFLACFVISIFSIVGLSACTTEEIKNNTAASLEAATGIVAVEYSQALAKDLLAYAIANFNNNNYSYLMEYKTFDEDHYITDYQFMKSYVYNLTNETICVPGELQIKNGAGIEFTYNSVVKRLKDTSNDTEKYYFIQNCISNEDEPREVKCYKQTTKIGYGGPGDLSVYIPQVTSGMCYLDGYSYINIDGEHYSGNRQLVSIKIKDGMIYGLTGTVYNDQGSLILIEKYTMEYDNLPEIPQTPETLQDLIADGYVEGNVYSLIESLNP